MKKTYDQEQRAFLAFDDIRYQITDTSSPQSLRTIKPELILVNTGKTILRYHVNRLTLDFDGRTIFNDRDITENVFPGQSAIIPCGEFQTTLQYQPIQGSLDFSITYSNLGGNEKEHFTERKLKFILISVRPVKQEFEVSYRNDT